MPRPIRSLKLDAAQRRELEIVINKPRTSQRMVRRAGIVLGRADGLSQDQTARLIGVNLPVVGKWEKRYNDAGLAGLEEETTP